MSKYQEMENLLEKIEEDAIREDIRKEFESIKELFPKGDETYLVISVRYDNVNKQIYTCNGRLSDVINGFYVFTDDLSEGIVDDFSVMVIKNDKEIYFFNSDSYEWPEED